MLNKAPETPVREKCPLCGAEEMEVDENRVFFTCGGYGYVGDLAKDKVYVSDVCDYRFQINEYKIALADAIRRPMGVIPDSAVDLVTTEELEAAEDRRQPKKN